MARAPFSVSKLGYFGKMLQRTLTYLVMGIITVQLTSCLTDLDSAVLLN